jgi:site-specific recombinase XerD
MDGRQGREYSGTHPTGRRTMGKFASSQTLQDASDRAKIVPAVSFHILRHAFASLLVSTGGIFAKVVAGALRHADTRMTIHC